MNRLMGAPTRNVPKSWLALAILGYEPRDVMNLKP